MTTQSQYRAWAGDQEDSDIVEVLADATREWCGHTAPNIGVCQQAAEHSGKHAYTPARAADVSTALEGALWEWGNDGRPFSDFLVERGLEVRVTDYDKFISATGLAQILDTGDTPT